MIRKSMEELRVDWMIRYEGEQDKKSFEDYVKAYREACEEEEEMSAEADKWAAYFAEKMSGLDLLFGPPRSAFEERFLEPELDGEDDHIKSIGFVRAYNRAYNRQVSAQMSPKKEVGITGPIYDDDANPTFF